MASEDSRPAAMPDASTPSAAPASATPAAAPLPRLAPFYPQSSLVHAFRRCWLLASTLGLMVGAGAGTLWWLSIPEHYRAEIRVRIPALRMASATSSSGEDEISYFQRGQAALIQSTTVLEEVLRRPEVARLAVIQQAHDPLAWLGDHLTVVASSIPDILLIRVADTRADEAAELAQAIAEVYRSTSVRQRQSCLRRLKKSHCRTEESLRRKRQRITQLENSRLAAAQRECQQARFDLRVARAELAVEEQRRAGVEGASVSEQAIAAYLKGDPAGHKLLREIEATEETIKRTFRVSALKENDPHLPELYRQRDEASKRLEARREEVRSILEQQDRLRAMQQYEARLNQRRERVAFYEGLVKSLEEEVQGLGGAASAEELKRLHEEAAADGELLRKLAADQERLESTSDPAASAEANESITVLGNDPRGRLLWASLGGAGCGGLIMLAVSWRELSRRRITSGSDIAGGLGLSVLGNIPRKRMGRTLRREDLNCAGRIGEAVDALRTVLLHDAGNGPRVLLISSAVGGEGKSTLAALLAASLARAWRKTLLLDADLRKPEAHQLFQTPLEPGLSEVLRGEAEAADVIHPTEVSRLWMVPAGRWDTHAIQALAQDGVGRLFDSLKEQYDFLVLDACPVLPVADALLLSRNVDAVLLTVRSGVSRLPVVQAAQQRLTALDVPLRGAVLMGPDCEVDGKAVVYPAAAK
ncbi:MAG TPA: polysaccharide biosynthesis tyrosine autokinase [Gemmataceae bacterium]|nr:polysaccharide biosynthesis tyrosine autokinase [Gemmataceae bacterium]